MSRQSPTSARADAYTRITSEIIAAMEAGAGTWHMPRHHDGTAITRPTNLLSGKPYRGINVLALWIATSFASYADWSVGYLPSVAGSRRPGSQGRTGHIGRAVEGDQAQSICR